MAKKDVRGFSDTELFEELDELKDDIFTLRMRQKVSGDDPAVSASTVRNSKKMVARLLTEIRRREINAAEYMDARPKQRKIFGAGSSEKGEAGAVAIAIDTEAIAEAGDAALQEVQTEIETEAEDTVPPKTKEPKAKKVKKEAKAKEQKKEQEETKAETQIEAEDEAPEEEAEADVIPIVTEEIPETAKKDKQEKEKKPKAKKAASKKKEPKAKKEGAKEEEKEGADK